MIYFDNAATTYPKPQCVYEAIEYGMRNYSFNAGRGSYPEAQSTYKMIEETRKKIAAKVNSRKENVVFTSSATESLNIILNGLSLHEGDNVFISPFEHNAVARTLNNIGVNICFIPFKKDTWELETDKFNDLLVLKKPKAIVISQISNVVGYELPYRDIFELGKKYGCITVLDSAQAFGIYNADPKNVDIMVFAGHKSLYAMFGIAGFINLSNISLVTFKTGGTGSDSLNLNMPIESPIRFEAGSLNAVGIYSINKSLDFLNSEDFASKEGYLTKYLIDELQKIDNVVVYLPEDYVSKGIVSFNVVGYTADEIGTILGEVYGICVRTGYHCAPFVHDFIDDKNYNGTVRVSIGIMNEKEEIDCLIRAIMEV